MMWVSECGYLPEKRVALVLGWNNVVGGCLGISGRRQKLQKEHQAPGDAGAELEALVHIMAAPMAPTTAVRKQVQFHT
jgi:hypothetical protein